MRQIQSVAGVQSTIGELQIEIPVQIRPVCAANIPTSRSVGTTTTTTHIHIRHRSRNARASAYETMEDVSMPKL